MNSRVLKAVLLGFGTASAGGAVACETCRPLVAQEVYGPGAGIGGGFGTTVTVLMLPLVVMVSLVALVGRAERPLVRSNRQPGEPKRSL